MLRRRTLGALGGALGVTALAGMRPARAEGGVKIGGIVSITGPTAAQGAGYSRAFELFPQQVAGVPLSYVLRDDGGDPTAAVNIANKMITEDKVDILFGPTLTSSNAAVLPVAAGSKVPMIGMAPISFDPQKYPWTFDDCQSAALMVDACAQHMKAKGAKTVGFIGYNDGWGDEVWNGLKVASAKYGIEIVVEERYARTDTSVQAQVLRAMTKHPDVMMLGGSAVPGALPNIALSQRGYKGQIYNNHGVVSPEYLRVGGAMVEGCIAPTGPLVVYDQLPDANPVKPVATKFMTAYLAKFGAQARNAFAGYTWDAYLLLENALPAVLKKAQPGTPEFRAALRDALEQTHELVGTHGVYTMSASDHRGTDDRARVLVQVQNGAWKLLQS
jgi:branched-chain amino acid transport system substrate-binding protein